MTEKRAQNLRITKSIEGIGVIKAIVAQGTALLLSSPNPNSVD